MESIENNRPTITFVGGARSVTGSNFLIEVPLGERTLRFLIDCGLTQGGRFCEPKNREPFPYDAKTIDAVFVTHAHADHIGLLPKLIKEGFAGPIYATAPTRDLIPIMLEDGATLIARESRMCGDEVPYTHEDARAVASLVQSIPYRTPIKLAEGVSVTFFNAGHIIGSATISITIKDTSILFTGDLGRQSAPLIPDFEIPPGPIDYLVTESVYGSRVHEKEERSITVLADAVRRIHTTKGALLIPAFSLERSQIILASLERLMSSGDIPQTPVYIDSPLAIKVTEVYRAHPEFLRDDIKKRLMSGDDPFSFPSLRVSRTREESESAIQAPSPKIIIAGAGMSHGGRIRSHEAAFLPDPQSMLLLVGYQTPGSLGRRLKDGAKQVTINNEKVPVRARIASVSGFSAHADRDDLLSFAEGVHPKRAFVVLGDMEASSFLAQRLSGFLGIETTLPQEGERFEI